ncbi:MAG: hypothetical protein AAE987_07270 [Thermoplasmataceae archaeon]|jgi:hypothetical protein
MVIHRSEFAEKKIVIYILNGQYLFAPTERKLNRFKQLSTNNKFLNMKTASDEEIGKKVREMFGYCITD